jgi:hypothetical protein
MPAVARTSLLDEYQEVARRLNERIEQLAAELLPAGYVESRRWFRVGSVNGEEGQSLAIELRGNKRGHWRDYAGTDFGDALDLVQAVRGGTKREAFEYAREWLKLPPVERPAPARARSASELTDEDDGRWREIWHEALPLTPDDPVWCYLAGREIDLDRLPAVPLTLRYHPRLWHKGARLFLPAMVGAVIGPDRASMIAIHRVWLIPKDGGFVNFKFLEKGKLKPQKKALGPVFGGVIPLTQGPSGRQWRDSAPGEDVGLSEGIEDGLTMAVDSTMAKRWRMLCGVSLSFMRGTVLPSDVAGVFVVEDNDDPDPRRERLLQQVEEHFQQLGKKVTRVRVKDRTVKDVNDAQRLRLARRRRLTDASGVA